MSLTGIGEVATAVSDIVDHFFPDKTQAEKDQIALQLQQAQLAATAVHDQTVVNASEAGSQSMFVAGWRPFIGWICGFSLMIAILGPLLSYLAALAGHTGIVFPSQDTGTMMTLLGGMLGLGSMRTYEKVSGLKPGH